MTPEQQIERAKRMRDAVMQHMPEIVPCIKDLVDNGLITGWRNIKLCGPGPRSGGIEADKLLINSQGLK